LPDPDAPARPRGRLALEARSATVRALACKVLAGVLAHLPSAGGRRAALVERLLAVLPALPSLGQNAAQLLEMLAALLGGGGGANPAAASSRGGPAASLLSREEDHPEAALAERLTATLARLVAATDAAAGEHANACVYRALARVVGPSGCVPQLVQAAPCALLCCGCCPRMCVPSFSLPRSTASRSLRYYLESEPCLICNKAEVPFAEHKLEVLKGEAKFTDSAQLVKLLCAQTIRRITVSISHARRLRVVKAIHFYYNNKPVADITSLKGRWQLWKKTASVELAPDQA
jgi:hypothetical protein